MSEKLIKIGLYRILRKMGVPREEVDLYSDFEKDYLLSPAERDVIFNLVEFRYNLNIPKSIEHNTHNANCLFNYIRTI